MKFFFQEQYKTIFLTLHLMLMFPVTVQSATEFLQKLLTGNIESPTSCSSLSKEFEVSQLGKEIDLRFLFCF